MLLKNARIKKIRVTPSLLTESRIGLFSNPKNKTELSKASIDSFFVKGQSSSKRYTISLILKEGISHDLFIEFKEQKTAEELIVEMKRILGSKDKINIDSELKSSQVDTIILRGNLNETQNDGEGWDQD